MHQSPEHLRAWIRPKGRRPYVLGHRGARAHCPENTLRAFERALDDGADGVELDVRMSADGELFIAHDDAIVLRGGDQRAAISRLSASQIRELNTASGEPVPTLREVLLFQSHTGCHMNVELKGDVLHPMWMAQKAAAQISIHGGDNILLSSFHLRIVHALTRLLPTVPTALLVDPQHKLLRRHPPARLLGACAMHPHHSQLDAGAFARMKKQVQVINTWTVNDPTEAVRLAQLGVDALIGDDPAMLLETLKQAGLK